MSSNCAKSAPKATEVAEMFRINGCPRTRGTKTRGLAKYVLIFSNSFWHRQSHENLFPLGSKC